MFQSMDDSSNSKMNSAKKELEENDADIDEEEESKQETPTMDGGREYTANSGNPKIPKL